MIGLIALVLVLANFTSAERHLEFVQMIFRHGDRAPAQLPYPNDPYTEKYWPNSWNQLTEEGFSQMRERGNYFRERYADLLGKEYNSSDNKFLLLTSPIERSVKSAEAFIMGLYDDCSSGDSKQEDDFNCANLMKMCNETDSQFPNVGHQTKCEKSDKVVTDLLHKEKFRVLGRYADVLQFLQQATGKAGFDHKDLGRLYHVQKEIYHNLTQPEWIHHQWPNHENRTTLQIAEEAYLAFLFNKFGAVGVDKFVAGPILRDFVRNAQKVAAGTQEYEFIAYSSHDTVMIALMSLFGVFNGKLPSFGATFIMEVYSNKLEDRTEYEVQLSYLNTEAEPRVFRITGFGEMCPLSSFTALYGKKGFESKKERDDACQGMHSSISSESSDLNSIVQNSLRLLMFFFLPLINNN